MNFVSKLLASFLLLPAAMFARSVAGEYHMKHHDKKLLHDRHAKVRIERKDKKEYTIVWKDKDTDEVLRTGIGVRHGHNGDKITFLFKSVSLTDADVQYGSVTYDIKREGGKHKRHRLDGECVAQSLKNKLHVTHSKERLEQKKK